MSDQHSRISLLTKIWGGKDPFDGFPTGLYVTSGTELGHGEHSYLLGAIQDTRASLAVEIGVWKGASSISMAKQMQALGTDGVVVAIDTWLGSSEHWMADNPWHASLNLEFGQPMLFRTFMANVVQQQVADRILPLPLDSVNANELFRALGIFNIDVLHLDAGHDYRSVTSDLEAWWPLIRPGGWLVGDDYLRTGDWPEVKRAFDTFFTKLDLMPLEDIGNKCRVQKPLT